MTYHVDLLLDDERRSASPVSLGMVMRLGSFTALAVLATAIMLLYMASRDVDVMVSQSKYKWSKLKPQHEELLNLRGARNEIRATHRQMEAFRRSRLELGPELAQLQLGIPEEVQLTSLRINQFVGNQKTGTSAMRSYEMRISGKVGGDNVKKSVDELIHYLSVTANTGCVESVVVPNNGFRKETVRVSAGETRTDWFFELVCRYRPRSFE
ncbi:MAG: hypothetical protein ACOYOU_01395 [Kiritimatiellia bacterium]